jgi:hypothetical protein
MLLTTAMSLAVLAIMLAFAHRSDRRLRSAAADLAPYRFGFVLGFTLYGLSLLALYRIVESLAASTLPVATAVWLVLVILAARGVCQRRRSGWVLAALLPWWFSVPAAAVVVLGGQPGPLAIVAVALISSAAMTIYARRRWHELGGRADRGSAAGGTAPPLVPVSEDAPGTAGAEVS